MKLGVNIDHVATLREARGGDEPDPIKAALICEKAGADSIVCHLREDRRHINDLDLTALKKTVTSRLNLEMSMNAEIVSIACRIKPDEATLVPERRKELTTEGGLDLISQKNQAARVIKVLKAKGIIVSLFIDPQPEQIKMAKIVAADFVELHTGEYALNRTDKEARGRIKELQAAAHLA
ncbi:MAG: pyridoxine 5'-phosphate synthase, partial [Candidatus Omnitrophota bacterium]